MKLLPLACAILIPLVSFCQNTPKTVYDPISFELVMDHPDMKRVEMKADIPYLKDAAGTLHMDVYQPPGLKESDLRPAIVFLNAIGDNPNGRKVKSWGIYTSWPKFMAANGYIGISMECDGNRIQESLQGIFRYLDKEGARWHVDAGKLGVYAASANVNESSRYLMSADAYPGIKAAALYYGGLPQSPFRKDLPVYFLIAEGDVARINYGPLLQEVLKNNAPWTITMGTGLPHAFDCVWDREASRVAIDETVDFWKRHLDPLPAPSWKPSKIRDAAGWSRMDPAKSKDLFRELAQEYPRDPGILAAYGTALNDAREYQEAGKVFEEVLKIQPEMPEALTGIIIPLYAAGRDKEAETSIEKALQAGFVNRFTYSRLGYNLMLLGKYPAAAKQYERSIALQPGNLEYYNLGCAYARLNEPDKALQALGKALESGNWSRQAVDADPDYESIRKDPRYQKLVSGLK